MSRRRCLFLLDGLSCHCGAGVFFIISSVSVNKLHFFLNKIFFFLIKFKKTFILFFGVYVQIFPAIPESIVLCLLNCFPSGGLCLSVYFVFCFQLIIPASPCVVFLFFSVSFHISVFSWVLLLFLLC